MNSNSINFTRWAFFNFIILALFGVVLRYMLCFPAGKINYLNILHAHSHFAFAGWMFLALATLIAKELAESVSASLRWIFLLTIVCSFGMLISFSLQGYKLFSIVLSTLFLFITYWFGYVVLRKWNTRNHNFLSRKLIKSSIWFLIVSSLGPLALGALKASGNTGIIYQNAIYFYLHFQLNGWMLFAALGLIANSFLTNDKPVSKSTMTWLLVFILSTIPLFFIFTLWPRPSQFIFIIAFLGAFFNALGWFVMVLRLHNKVGNLPLLVRFAVIAVSVKVIFQLIVCVPQMAEWTFANRNLIIGYVHLITLGCVTPIIINRFISAGSLQSTKTINGLYCVLTLAYLILLFLQPLLNLYAMSIPHFQYCLFIVSVLFGIAGIYYYKKLFCQRSTNLTVNSSHSHHYSQNLIYESNN